MTVKSRLFLSGSVSVLIAALVGAGGLVATGIAESGVQRASAIAVAIRNHMEADMIHDALRADVLTALKAGLGSVTAGSRETSASSALVLKAATDLANNGSVLRGEVDAFLKAARNG